MLGSLGDFESVENWVIVGICDGSCSDSVCVYQLLFCYECLRELWLLVVVVVGRCLVFELVGVLWGEVDCVVVSVDVVVSVY